MSSVEATTMAPITGSGRDVRFALRQIVTHAVTRAEIEAIRQALGLTHGNKSRAARLLRTNYTTLHAKMRRHGISAQEFQGRA
jgi:two-component system nitrogen regulation response regulator GlnG